MKDMEIDMWLIYTSEGTDPCLPLIVGLETVGPGAFIFTKEGKKLAICSSIDAQDLETSKLFDKVYKYTNDFADVLTQTVKTINPKNIALNTSKSEHLADGLTEGRLRWLKRTLSTVFTGNYLSSASFLTKVRSIKSQTEIEKIRQAIKVTQDIYAEVFEQMRVGMTEKDVGQLFVDGMNKRGVINAIDRTLSMPIVMKENISHRAPSDVVINPGDLLIMDFSVDIDGYVSDIARTVYFLREGEEKPPKEVQDAFNAVHQAISLAADAIKPGVKGYEVDAVPRNYYIEKGYPEITHSTGHQIGRDVHDGGAMLAPRWSRYLPGADEVIQPGMVFTIEPTLFLENDIHFIVEENVVVTEDGIEYLSERQNELILIEYK